MSRKADILVVGSGGREHALIKKLESSSGTGQIYAVHGNGGISRDAEILDIDNDITMTVKAALERAVDLVVVGPELPLIHGLADACRKKDIKVFGPTKKAAKLEGSKIFAKGFMKRHNIPTADFEVFEDPDSAKEYLASANGSVIKADGLCAGKGVYVTEGKEEAFAAVDNLMVKKKFGKAGCRIIVEEKLVGEEASVIAIVSEKGYSLMLPSQDHKRAYDGDKGPNTGGMGAYAPTAAVSESVMKKVRKDIIEPVIEGLKAEGISYQGALYAGLMIKDNNPYVLEFNVRFGDPETEAILPLLESDILDVLLGSVENRDVKLKWKKGACVDVVLASKGYPGRYAKGKKIDFNFYSIPKDVEIYHAGTEYRDGSFYTSGGRVLNIAAIGEDIIQARKKAYRIINKINFEGMHFRKDIGIKEERRLR